MAHNKKQSLVFGSVLAISFFAILALIFSPVFGNGMNGLTYADDMFNKLSKGSSYFIPKLQKSLPAFSGRAFSTSVTLDKPEAAEKTAALFTAAGATVALDGGKLTISGDLGQVLGAAVRDSDEMYKNDGAAVSARYGYPEKDVLRNWHGAFSKIDKDLKKNGKIEESKMVTEVMKRGLETCRCEGARLKQSPGEKEVAQQALGVSAPMLQNLWRVTSARLYSWFAAKTLRLLWKAGK